MSPPRLVVGDDRVTAYLLDLTSEDGGSKAKFFLGRGFRSDDPLTFVRAPGQHGADHWPGRAMATRFGEKRVLAGPMPCPDGSAPGVLAVWIASADRAEASLVTAYPAS